MSAIEVPGFAFTLPSGTDYSNRASTGQYRFVNQNSSGNAVNPSAGGTAIGVRQNLPKSAESMTILRGGISRVEAGGTIAVNDPIMCDSSGRAVVATSGNAVLGIALSAGASGELVSVLLALETGEAAGLGSGYSVLAFSIPALSAVANGDVLTEFPLAFDGTIVSVAFRVLTAVTTPAKAATLNLELGTTNLTGGVVSLTSANCTPAGAVVAGTAVTANNSFVAGDKLSIEASAVTAFIEGAGELLVTVSL